MCCKSVNKKFINRKESRFAGHVDFLSFATAVKCAPATGSLVGNQLVFIQAVCPIGNNMAVAGAADRVFCDRKLGGEAAGNTVCFPAAGRDMD